MSCLWCNKKTVESTGHPLVDTLDRDRDYTLTTRTTMYIHFTSCRLTMIAVFQSLAVLIILSVTLTSCESLKTKRDVANDVVNSFRHILPSSRTPSGSCSSIVGDALIDCRDELKFQTRNLPIPKKTDDSRCCHFAHFRKCVRDSAQGSCGTATDGVVDELLTQGFGEWMRDCGEYDYYAPICLFYLWYTWVTVVAVIAIVIACCCGICFLRCICCC